MSDESRLDRYPIVRKINSGGMATVFLAKDLLLNRQIALKKLHPHLLDQKNAVTRFTNEANAIASLSHENIIKIYDYGESKDGPFLVMEFIDGLTLKDFLDRYAPLPNFISIEIARQIALGLQCAHAQHIIHRDIKPANILIKHDGSVVITDFGKDIVKNLN